MSRYITWVIVLVMVIAIMVVNIPKNIKVFGQETRIRQGLDLQGGQQVLMEADLPADQNVPAESMEVAAQVIENRVNALGVSEAVVQLSLPRRIVVELPGYDNPEEARKLIQNTWSIIRITRSEFFHKTFTKFICYFTKCNINPHSK